MSICTLEDVLYCRSIMVPEEYIHKIIINEVVKGLFPTVLYCTVHLLLLSFVKSEHNVCSRCEAY
jgi:hypothetical protein